ncbi:MAG: DMT family transporter [Bacteroidota bacterium]
MQLKSINKNIINWGILVLLGLTWGSSFILMKKGLQVFTAQELGALRIFAAAVFLLPWSLIHLGRLHGHQYRYLLLSGLIGTLVPAFLVAQAQMQLDSAVSGILNSLVPVFVLLIGNIWFRQAMVRNELFGALIGLFGASLLIFLSAEQGIGRVNYYALLPLAACCLYGLNTNLIKYRLQGLPSTAIISVSFLFIGAIAGVVLFTQTDFVSKLRVVEGASIAMGYVLLLGIWGTAIAQLFLIKLIQRTSPVFASMVSFLIPLVALGWGLLDGEVLALGQCLGVIIILGGVYLVNKR